MTTYTLRHTHASALHYAPTYGAPSRAPARALDPVHHVQHYAHVIDALKGKPSTRTWTS